MATSPSNRRGTVKTGWCLRKKEREGCSVVSGEILYVRLFPSRLSGVDFQKEKKSDGRECDAS
jgi:hypothetical protein